MISNKIKDRAFIDGISLGNENIRIFRSDITKNTFLVSLAEQAKET